MPLRSNLREFAAVLLSECATAVALLSAAVSPDNKRPAIRGGVLRARVYPLLQDAAEAGAAFGWRRAWKHRDDEPAEDEREACCAAMADAFVSEVCERFALDDDRDE